MISKVSRAQMRQKKHRRLRNHIVGTAQRPRLCVFRSNNHMYAQIIDDTIGNTLVSASTLQKEVRAELENTDDVAAAAHLGTVIGKKAVEAGKAGLESTRNIVATKGRAMRLGERAIGHLDPGAASAAEILEVFYKDMPN